MAGLTARIDFMHERGQLLRFAGAGMANTGFAYAIYAAGIAFGLTYSVASLIALIAGIVSGFVIQGKVAFRTQLQGRFALFVALWVLLYGANITLIGALHFFGMNLYIAGLLAAIPITAASYLALRTIVFAASPLPVGRMALLWCVGAVFVARLYIVTHLSLNWDEFLNLSMLYDYRRGDMTEVFQTGFIHLFHWLPYVSGNEVDQLIAARLVTLCCAVLTSVAIFHTARRFMDIDRALVAVLAYNCFGASLLYGTDFRTDTLATTAMMAAVALATHRHATWPRMIAMGLLIAIGGAMTIKAAFFLPVIGVLVLGNALGSARKVRTATIIAGGAAVCAAAFALIIGLHAASLPETASAATFLGRTGNATLFTGDYLVLSNVWLPALLSNIAFWALVACGIASLACKHGQATADRIMLAGFVLPAFVPLIYSEMYVYFHPFLIAPISVLAGAGFGMIGGPVRFALIALLLVNGVTHAARKMDDGLAGQRMTLEVIHRLFPEPVAYIDHTSMVASFPKKGFFMSRWGVTDYRMAGEPVMADIVRRDQPAFVLETRSLLAVDRISPAESQRSEMGLFGADVAVLRDNYLRYWGPVFLPGKLLNGNGNARISIAGAYRVDGNGTLTVNGTTYSDGDTVRLAPGDYAYSSVTPFRLVWDAPPPPATTPPERLFSGW